MIWKCSQYSFDAKMPIIMGILNLTPDSFSDGGSYPTPEDAIARGRTPLLRLRAWRRDALILPRHR